MQIILSDALAALPRNAGFTIANEARPPANYLFAQILPERAEFTYQASSGSMTVRATMAGMVGMDSPYPEVGVMEAATFSEATVKLAARVRLPEAALRKLQDMLMRLAVNGQPTVETIQTEALNFLDKMVVQAHLDTAEWLRGQALVNGQIDWTFNKKRLLVDYGVPSTHKLTTRTDAANTAYFDTASAFWTDIRSIRRLLKGNVRAILAHPDTIDDIRYNTANSLVTVDEDAGGVTFRRVNASGAFTADVGDAVRIISYGEEAEIFDLANPGQTVKIPFLSRGKLVGIGNNTGTNYVVGAGGTDPVENALGYTHLAPTVEGGGRPGRWAEVYTPQNEPWAIEARGASNLLPVIEAPEKIVIATTEMSS